LVPEEARIKDVHWIGDMKEKNQKTHELSPELLKRFNLEFLDQFVCEKRGYDPYDTSKRISPDVWSTKRKRA
jgi:hypothetical protein